MKKIMGKALGVMLAFVMMLSLTPMTAFAASLSMTGEFAVDGSTNTVWYDGEEMYSYTWTPEADGSYTFTFYEDSWVCMITHEGEYGTAYDYEQHNYNNSTGSFVANFTGGVEYSITVANTSYAQDDINFSVTPGTVLPSGPVAGGSSLEQAADVTEGMEGVIGHLSTGYFAITGLDNSKTYTLTVENATQAISEYNRQIGVVGYNANGTTQGETAYQVMSVSTEVTPLVSGVILFAVENGGFGELTATFSIEEVGGSTAPGGDTAGSSLETAIDLTASGTINVVANGKNYYSIANLDNSKQYNVTVTNSAFGPAVGQQQIGLTAYYNGEADGETVYNVGAATVVVKPGRSGIIYFSVENIFEHGDLNATVTVSEVTENDPIIPDPVPNPAGTYENPAELVVGENTATVAGWETYWFEYTASTAGRLWVTVDADVNGWTYDIYNSGEYIDYITSGKEDIIVAAGDVIKLGFGHEDGNAVIPFEVEFEAGTFTKMPNGKETAPYPMVMGDNTVDVPLNAPVWYTYVATEDGTLTLTMKTDESPKGWFYDGYVNDYDYTYFPANPDTYMGPSSTDTDPASLRSIPVRAGDVVKFMVMTAWDENYDRPAGTVVFNAWFTAGEVSDAKKDYIVSDEVLVLGNNTVELDPSAETTIFEFSPEETGLYKFTTDNGVVGYWGGGSFFVSDQTENKTATLKHNYDSLGPSIMVGVTGEGEATIKVERVGAAETKPTIPTIVYTNTTTPEYLEVFDTEISLDNTVNVGDFTEDTAVLGADGYYHLNSADGPVLFAHLNNDRISLFSAYGYGRVNGVITNDDNETIAIVDYNEAFMEYYSAAYFVDITEDIANAYYPVTEDLATMLKDVAEKEGWYLFIEEAMFPDETWMVICSYDENVTSIDEELEKAEVEDANVVIKDSGKITADSLEAIIETTASDNVVFTVEAGDKTVSYEFAVEDLELIDGKETYDFSVELVDDYASATEDEADIDEDRFVLRVNFSYEGDLPATAIISIPVGADYAGKTLGYYEVLADGTLKHLCDTVVDADGIAKVTQDHCSDYVLLAPATVAPGGTTTGDATNFALWIAVLGLGIAAIAGSVVMRKREF